MKFFKSYMIQLISALTFMLLVICVMGLERKTSTNDFIIDYNDHWIVGINGQEKEYAVLPRAVATNGSSKVVLTKLLPDKIENQGAIEFFSIHQNIRVYVEEELVYSFYVEEGSYSKEPGNGWNFVELNREYGGKKLSIEIQDSYSDQKITLPTITYGSYFDLISHRFNHGIIPFILSVIMLMFGVIMLFVWIFYRKKLRLYSGVMWLGMFAVFISFWSVLETQILPIFLGHHLVFANLSFLSLKLLFIPIVMFVSYTFDLRDNRILKLFCYTNMLDFYVTVTLQIIGIADFTETQFVSHILFILAATWMIFLSGRILWNKRFEKGQKKRTVITHSVCMGIVGAATVIDLYRYYFIRSYDSAFFCRIGLFIYVLMISTLILGDTVRLVKRGEEVDTMREDAMIDGLTKMKNRNAFQREIAMLSSDYLQDVGVVMFDLNNLKFFNDFYGHNMGDYYIIICSEVVMDIFGGFGDVYRIGGDEFCALVFDVSEAKFASLQELMNVRINALNGQYLQNKMSIASGYARYDEKYDMNLNDTLQRADKQMYDKKEQMKN